MAPEHSDVALLHPLFEEEGLRLFGFHAREQRGNGLVHRPQGTSGCLLAFFLSPAAISCPRHRTPFAAADLLYLGTW